MNEKLFRKESIDRISSPNQLSDYIRVSNPSVWMILAAIVIFLAGICVWGVFGNMDTKLDVVAVSDNGVAVCYVKEADITQISVGMPVRCNDAEYTVASILPTSVAVDGNLNAYTIHVGDLRSGEWVYTVTLEGAMPDGVYPAQIIVDSVTPASFVLN